MPRDPRPGPHGDQDAIDRYLRGELTSEELERFELEQLADPEQLDAAYAAIALSMALERSRTEPVRSGRGLSWQLGTALALGAVALVVLMLQFGREPTRLEQQGAAQATVAAPHAVASGRDMGSVATVLPAELAARGAAAEPSEQATDSLKSTPPAHGVTGPSGSTLRSRIVVASGLMGSSQIRVLNPKSSGFRAEPRG